MEKYYITTPIYYANAKIHFGNLYTSLIADVIARSKRLLGYDVFYGTGTDENGQKMTKVAEKEGKNIQEFLDEIVHQDRQVMSDSSISYNDFVRTTEPRHHQLVQTILQQTYDNGYIYQGRYEGLYCVGCESFKKQSDLIEWQGKMVCPDHLVEPELIKEKNRFFKLTAFEDKLKSFYQSHPKFLQPQYRYNETLSFVEQGLEDFSISRQGNNFGIPLPFDKESVTYIRYDALLNYLTMIVDHYDESGKIILKDYGRVMHHTIGKDIARFHAVYRPAMLMAAGYTDYLPQQEFVGGFFTVNGQKMSKSLGNTLYMDDLLKEYERDAIVFYLLYDIPQGSDGDFSLERLRNIEESMLMAGRGNLVSRVTKLAIKYNIQQGIKHSPDVKLTLSDLNHAIDTATIQNYLQRRYEAVQASNIFMQSQEPWILLKSEDKNLEGKKIIEQLLRNIKQLSLLSAPFLITSFSKIQSILGNTLLAHIDSSHNLGDPLIFSNIFELDTFDVQLQSDVIYHKKNPSTSHS